MTLKRRIRAIALPVIWKISPTFFKKRFRHLGQIFSIGIYSGNSPLTINGNGPINNPVITAADITDIPAAFVADPFLLFDNDRWCMFFEVYNQLKRRGEIGLAISEDLQTWNYKTIVLKSPFHLSYPHVFMYENRYYMIPESMHEGVGLYQAQAFPYKWKLKKKLIDQQGLVDSTIFHYDGLWWLFTSQDGRTPDIQTLHLYCAEKPDGNWTEHPNSPVKRGRKNLTRCAGRVIYDNGRLIRFAQTSIPSYGTDVRAFEIFHLSKHDYQEKEARPDPIISGTVSKWNSGGMHHIDAQSIEDGKWVASVDGWYDSRRVENQKRLTAKQFG